MKNWWSARVDLTMIGMLVACQFAVAGRAHAQTGTALDLSVVQPAVVVSIESALRAPAQRATTMSGVLPVRYTLSAGMTQRFGGAVSPAHDESAAGSFFTEPAVRPTMLVPLYISMATLQALDVVSTRQAIGAGGTEANPLVAPLSGSPAAMLAMKAGVSAVTILVSERMWRHNRKGALLMLFATNIGYAAVVSHNFALAAHAPGTR
jgi:hypothetical protein